MICEVIAFDVIRNVDQQLLLQLFHLSFLRLLAVVVAMMVMEVSGRLVAVVVADVMTVIVAMMVPKGGGERGGRRGWLRPEGQERAFINKVHLLLQSGR